jgi:hypothetical protein
MVKGLAKFMNRLHHGQMAKYVDVSPAAMASGGYSPMTANNCMQEQLASQSAIPPFRDIPNSILTMFTSAQTGACAHGQIRTSQHHLERTP